MHITTEWFDGKYPQFNLSLHSEEGRDAFLTIRGCRIVSREQGDFVSYPATKNDKTNKWWNHAVGSEKFNERVLKMAQEAKPAPQEQSQHQKAKANGYQSQPAEEFKDDIPFLFNLNTVSDTMGAPKSYWRAKHGKELSMVRANKAAF